MINRQRKFVLIAFLCSLLTSYESADGADWPEQGPCDETCLSNYVWNDLQTTERTGLSQASSMTLSGYGCYDVYPRDNVCDLAAESNWSSAWAQRQVTVQYSHTSFAGSSSSSTVQGLYSPFTLAGDTYVRFDASAPLQEGNNGYHVVGSRDSVSRTRVALLSGYVIPTIPVEIDWLVSDSDVEEMNNRPNATPNGLPEGFSFAQLVRAQSMVWFFQNTHGTAIEFCNDDTWPASYACPTTKHVVRVRNGTADLPLGETFADSYDFPLAASAIPTFVSEVNVAAVAAYVDLETCEDSQCGLKPLSNDDELYQRLDDVAYMIGTTAAHEAAHATALVPMELLGNEAGHVSASSETIDVDASGPIMAEHVEETGGFGVTRVGGVRTPVRDTVGWARLNWQYLVHGR